jgi:hypothetical protein
MEDVEQRLLQALHDGGAIADSGAWAAAAGADHAAVVGTIKSLLAAEMVTAADIDHFRYALTEEAAGYVAAGATPEAAVFNAVPAGDGLPLSALKAAVPGEAGDVGFKQAMQQRWLGMDKSGGGEPRVVRKVAAIDDAVLSQLRTIAAGGEPAKAEAEALKKRKLVRPEAWKTYALGRGPKFALQRTRQATDLTQEMLAKGTWRTEEFKAYNFDALGVPPAGGALHPLLKARARACRPWRCTAAFPPSTPPPAASTPSRLPSCRPAFFKPNQKPNQNPQKHKNNTKTNQTHARRCAPSSARSSPTWASPRCRPPTTWSRPSGTLTPCSSRSSTRRVMRTTRSSCASPPPPATRRPTTCAACARCTRRRVGLPPFSCSPSPPPRREPARG